MNEAKAAKLNTEVNITSFNHIALRQAKIVCNFGLSECNRVKYSKKHDDRSLMWKNLYYCLIYQRRLGLSLPVTITAKQFHNDARHDDQQKQQALYISLCVGHALSLLCSSAQYLLFGSDYQIYAANAGNILVVLKSFFS